MKSFLIGLIATTTVLADYTAPTIPAGNQARCERQVCKMIGEKECNEDIHRKIISDACQNQLDSRCLSTVSKKLSTFEKDSLLEVLPMAYACQYATTKCYKKITKELSVFDQDSMVEVTGLIRSCKYVEQPCLKDFISKLSTFDVNDNYEVMAIANACSGNYERNCLTKKCNKLGSFDCDDFYEVKDQLRSCIVKPYATDY